MITPSANVVLERPEYPAQRRSLDPWRALHRVADAEPDGVGGSEACLTLFLTGSECPLQCVFCDLSQHTLLGATPSGAIPTQIKRALGEELGTAQDEREQLTLKLYNASNLFENRAVPAEDDEAILRATEGFRRVVVECHPRWIGRRFDRFADRMGERLEVAMGLETCHPDAFPKLRKGIDLDGFNRAGRRVVEAGATLRTFVLIGAPFVDKSNAEDWVVRTVEHSVELGARFVSLIPLRPNPRLEHYANEASRPTMSEVENSLRSCLAAVAEPSDRTRRTIVAVDPWDLEELSDCSTCFASRVHRLEMMQRELREIPPIECTKCSAPQVRTAKSIHNPRAESKTDLPESSPQMSIVEGDRS